jgi:putative membrane protein
MDDHHVPHMSGATWMWMPTAPPSWQTILAWHPQPIPISLILAMLGVVLYASGVIRMSQRGLKWPWWNTLGFTLGIGSMIFMFGSDVNGYGMWLFSVHMVQHMVLNMVTPVLILIGRPITLALRALKGGSRSRVILLKVLHSRYARVITSPLFTLPMFVFSLYGLYFTPLFDILMNNWLGHDFMMLHFVATGLALYWPILGLDPSPYHVGNAIGFLESLLPQPFHAFFAITVMDANGLLVKTFANPPLNWGINTLADQRMGGGLAWAFSELPGLFVTLIIGVMWFRSSQREAKRIDRSEDRTGDEQLEQYNKWLESLQEQG